jgi:N-carbamoylputrescine amidase
MLDRAPKGTNFLLFPELATTQYWCRAPFSQKYFRYAEPLDGTTIRKFAHKAKELGAHILLSFFESAEAGKEYYSSVAVLSPGGELVKGSLPDGRQVDSYRKVHLSDEQFRDLVIDETRYMRSGSGFPVFQTEFGRIGILVCRDRWFPESWRVLALQGAEIIFVATASAKSLQDLFIPSMRTWGREHQVFSVIANKVGREVVGKTVTQYCGSSCIVGPDGRLVKRAGNSRPRLVAAKVDLSEVKEVRRQLPNYRDRRPHLYGPVTASV